MLENKVLNEELFKVFLVNNNYALGKKNVWTFRRMCGLLDYVILTANKKTPLQEQLFLVPSV